MLPVIQETNSIIKTYNHCPKLHKFVQSSFKASVFNLVAIITCKGNEFHNLTVYFAKNFLLSILNLSAFIFNEWTKWTLGRKVSDHSILNFKYFHTGFIQAKKNLQMLLIFLSKITVFCCLYIYILDWLAKKKLMYILQC